jgi:hypothetical protein
MPIISEAGAYPDIPNSDYHRNAELLPGPSLSSSGCKTLLKQSPFHFWFNSPLNPDRPPEDDKPHFAFGRAAHDYILLPDTFSDEYMILSEDFSWAKTRACADEIEAANAWKATGRTVLTHDQALAVEAAGESLKANPLAVSALTNGETEVTLAHQDEETGVWLRARPDFLPNTVKSLREVRIVADLKFMAGTHCSPGGFSRQLGNFGYHISAAFYFDAIKAVYGDEPTHWLHIVVEREPPYTVSLYELPLEDIQRGRYEKREGVRKFADCLESGRWPAYADEPISVGLTPWLRSRIDEGDV